MTLRLKNDLARLGEKAGASPVPGNCIPPSACRACSDARLGHSATGTRAGSRLFMPPNWHRVDSAQDHAAAGPFLIAGLAPQPRLIADCQSGSVPGRDRHSASRCQSGSNRLRWPRHRHWRCRPRTRSSTGRPLNPGPSPPRSPGGGEEGLNRDGRCCHCDHRIWSEALNPICQPTLFPRKPREKEARRTLSGRAISPSGAISESSLVHGV